MHQPGLAMPIPGPARARAHATFLSRRGLSPLYSPRMMRWLKHLGLVAAISFAGSPAAFSADLLKWDAAADTVEARIETWTVPQLLQRVARATGWQIYLDPAITNRIPTRFTGKQPGDALRRMLGDYNYALVPEKEGPARLFVFRSSRDQATKAIAPVEADAKSAKGLIGNELIVTLKPGEKIEDLAKKLGAKVIGKADGSNTYRLRFDDDAAAQAARSDLANNPAVESVDSNYYVARPEDVKSLGSPGGPLGLSPKAAPDGKYTVVGLIDTAVQPKEGNFADFLAPGASASDTKSGGEPTHGTSMAETLLKSLAAVNEDKSTSVRILPVNVYSEGGEQTTTFDIANGIYKAVNGGAMIVNLSLGGEGDSSFLHNTIVSAYNQGVVFVASAGNTPVDTPVYPAAYPEVISVTASDRSGNLASYANRATSVDVMAPGGSVVTYGNTQFYVVGTSTAAAYASGLAAGVAEASGSAAAWAEAEKRKQHSAAVEAAIRKMLAPKK